ncbi:L-lactate permease [Bacillus shihchuchen]|uniref:L-lactate permease n=1 Tax=Bacillus shihchuchen TaxID=3036942 RepID=A0ABT7KX12_9BACI|nr:L-lactate permease [Bacillus shihchuchen]
MSGTFYFSVFFISPHEQNGVHRSSSAFLEEVTQDRLLQMLLMCFGICPLIESVSGFGIGFMVAAPIFLSLGYKPFQAVLLSFIGLLASSWGQWQPVRLSVRSLPICLLQHSVQIQRY